MEKVIEVFEEMSLKANLLDEAMVLIPHKSDLISKHFKLSKENKEVKNLETDIKASLKNHEESIDEQYKKTREVISRVNRKMMYLLERLEEQEKHEQNSHRALREINIPGTPKLYDRAGASQAFSEHNTPRMLVAEYAKSPFTKKRTKVQLQFSDFEADITPEEFAKVPAYMKGRSHLSELQDFLENVVMKTFNNKYRTLYLHRSSLKPSEFNLQSMFKSQTSYFEGQKFITVGDLARILERNVDKKDDRYIQMLRHLQIIREARKNSTVCYIWLKSVWYFCSCIFCNEIIVCLL